MTPSPLTPSTTRALNRLIVACNDDIATQRAATAHIEGATRRSWLEDRASRRASFVTELTELVEGGGGSTDDGGSALESARATFARLRHTLIGKNAGDAYTACARVETKTEKLYGRAIEGALTPAVRDVLERQHAEIEADRVELRRLSVGA